MAQNLYPTLAEVVRLARRDVYSEFHQGSGKGRYETVARPLSDEDIRKHLDAAGPHFGVYLMKDGSDKTQIAVFDFDSHDGAVPWGMMRDIVLRVAQTARRMGLYGLPLRSGGGHGVHLFFKWDHPQQAADVRKLLSKVLAIEGFRNGSGGVAAAEIEIFPKQDRVAESGYGNLIAAPFARASVPLSGDINPADEPILWASSAAVAREDGEEEKEQIVGEADIEVVADALRYIKNDNLDYESWLNIGLALKAALGDKGRALFIEWSKQSPKNVEAITAKKWGTFYPERINVGTIYYHARKGGWAGTPHEAPPFSELWLAIKFIDDAGGGLRYTADIGKWNWWSGVHWCEDHTLQVQHMAAEWCRHVAMQANKKRGTLASAKTVSAVVTLARTDRRVAVEPDQWDRNPWLLTTPEGTVDLRSGLLQPSNPMDYATRLTTAAPGGASPLWLKTVHEICGGKQDRIDYLQRLAGYFLTGVTREEKIFFLYGTGRNGKGTFIETLGLILGDYSTTVAMSTLILEKHSEHPTEIAKLRGMRLAMASETRDGARWNVARLKALTGGDVLTARVMRGDFFDFMPTHKLVVSSNRKPALGTVDAAIAHRLELIPFDVTFDLPDKLLKERLRAELGGIFAWAIEGCLAWQRHGIATPVDILAATREYLHAQDDIEMFLDDKCEVEAGAETKVPVLYALFIQWCNYTGAYAISKKEFTLRLGARGIEIVRRHGNVAFAQGYRPQTYMDAEREAF